MFLYDFSQDSLMNRKLKRTAFIEIFEIEIFCNMINVFTVIFNQFNESSMNKIFSFLFFNITDPYTFEW